MNTLYLLHTTSTSTDIVAMLQISLLEIKYPRSTIKIVVSHENLVSIVAVSGMHGEVIVPKS